MAPRRSVASLVFVGAGLAVALLLAFFVSPFASSQPDGLEKVATEHGFIDTAGQSAVAESPLADYATDGIDSERLSVGIAGAIGVVVTFAVGGLLFLLMKQLGRRGTSAQDRAGGRGATAAT
jgi:cobalt/nickel transport system permease protein/cobalt/nickel transport protein